MFKYQQQTNTGCWLTMSEHENSADAEACLGRTIIFPERVIDASTNPPQLIVRRDLNLLPSADYIKRGDLTSF